MVRRRLAGSGAARGIVNRKRTQRVMREYGLLVPQRRIPRDQHAGRIETQRSDEVWATDLTKIPTREGWLWMVSVIDCHDRDLIGRRYGTSADTALCLGALHDAVWERFPDQLDELKTAARSSPTTGARSSPAAATRPSFARSPSRAGRR